MSNTDLELPGMEDLERVPPKPKPKYRSHVYFAVAYEGYIEYQTDGDPYEWLEADENVSPPLESIRDEGDQDDFGFPDYSPVEVSYDDGVTWEMLS